MHAVSLSKQFIRSWLISAGHLSRRNDLSGIIYPAKTISEKVIDFDTAEIYMTLLKSQIFVFDDFKSAYLGE
jgi:hypothetical protein